MKADDELPELKLEERRIVAVFGSALPAPGSAAWREAEELGSRLAQAGWVVMNGGYAGTMGAVSKGARDRDGFVIGITCAAFGDASPNPHLSQEVKAKDLWQRIQYMLMNADAFIILDGGTGTLMELAAALELTGKGFLTPRPVIFLGPAWEPLLDKLARDQEPDPRFPGRQGMFEVIHRAPDPETVVILLREVHP